MGRHHVQVYFIFFIYMQQDHNHNVSHLNSTSLDIDGLKTGKAFMGIMTIIFI